MGELSVQIIGNSNNADPAFAFGNNHPDFPNPHGIADGGRRSSLTRLALQVIRQRQAITPFDEEARFVVAEAEAITATAAASDIGAVAVRALVMAGPQELQPVTVA